MLSVIPETPGCNFSVSIDTPDVIWQAGVSVIPTACVKALDSDPKISEADLANLTDEFKAVALWVFSFSEARASVTFALPKIIVRNVDAILNIGTGYLGNVTISRTNYTGTNNVTGSPLNGKAYNG